jgi:multidrug transporter EmrE-like cation transporter
MTSPIISAALWMTVLSSVEAVALTLLRMGGTEKIIAASLLYGLGVVPLLLKTLDYEGIGMVNFLWNIFSTIIMFIIGIYVFKEKIHYLQIIGILVSFLGIGIVLLSPEE